MTGAGRGGVGPGELGADIAVHEVHQAVPDADDGGALDHAGPEFLGARPPSAATNGLCQSVGGVINVDADRAHRRAVSIPKGIGCGVDDHVRLALAHQNGTGARGLTQGLEAQALEQRHQAVRCLRHELDERKACCGDLCHDRSSMNV